MFRNIGRSYIQLTLQKIFIFKMWINSWIFIKGTYKDILIIWKYNRKDIICHAEFENVKGNISIASLNYYNWINNISH